MQGTWQTTGGGGSGLLEVVAAILVIAVVASIAGPVVAAVGELVHILLIAVAVIGGLAAVGLVAFIAYWVAALRQLGAGVHGGRGCRILAGGGVRRPPGRVTAHTEHRGRPARDCGSPRPLRDGASTRVRGLRQRNRRVHSSCYSPQVSRWHTAAGTTPTGSPPGRTRLRAPDRGSSERRRRRRGWPVWGLGPASYGGGAAGIRTRPAPRSAPPSRSRSPLHGAARAAHPPPGHGPRSAAGRVAAHAGLGPGECRGHHRPARRAGESGPGLRADPGAV
jgi:hypothetical protein